MGRTDRRPAAPAGPPPPVRAGVGSVDHAAAVVATLAAVAVALLSTEAGARPVDLLGVGLLATAGAALLVRRRWPATVLIAVSLVTTGYLTLDYPGGAETPLLMVGLYTCMAYGRRLVAVLVATAIAVSSSSYRLGVEGEDPLIVVVTVSLLVLVVLLGDGARTRRRLREEIRERLRVLELDRELEAQRRVTAERLRVARELHDVLAHTITAISVHAGATADGLPAGSPAHEALRSVRATAAEAMHQLTATIAVLRADDDAGPPPPTPDLGRLGDLVKVATDAGLDVTLDADLADLAGAADGLPFAVQLTAYRVVQESLTNVVRHAGATQAWVRLDQHGGDLHVVVEDDGTARPAASGHGYGILGMTERAQAVGGRLAAGPRPAGGFRVEAVLPTGRAPR